MKSLLSLFAAVGLTFGVAAAQDLSGNANNSVAGIRPGTDISGFHSPAKLNQTPNESSKFPNTHPDLRPQLGGVLVVQDIYTGKRECERLIEHARELAIVASRTAEISHYPVS